MFDPPKLAYRIVQDELLLLLLPSEVVSLCRFALLVGGGLVDSAVRVEKVDTLRPNAFEMLSFLIVPFSNLLFFALPSSFCIYNSSNATIKIWNTQEHCKLIIHC